MPRVLLAPLTALLLLTAVPQAGAATYRLVAPDGTVYFTNAPTDPRFRRLREGSGTDAGWLRISGGSASRYPTEISEAAARYGVPQRLVEAIIRVESGFNATAVSTRGAQGLMQLMPATASILGVRDAFNPRQNIDGGVRHLRGLMERYPHDLRLVVAAYNAGEQAVNWYGGIPPFPETRQYVERVLTEFQGHGSVALPDTIYRYVAPDGTITYTNVPRSRR